ncbi:hypothetical protein [Chryseobacterium sp.]|uniref:hypothetical protein n=1 Tax=Chryseobacterium sp. TaxID=1871047 RepID=UPI0011C94DB6|nr:hypothetical protein [Chryseobacterium sp.]TXF77278.1 hypothetical protein FUA25_04890 [Chryseobacterium sp.]
MKKINLYLVIMIGISSLNCNAKPETPTMDNTNYTSKQSSIQEVYLEEKTRGTNRAITFAPNEKTVTLNGVTTKTKVLPGEWDAIVKTVGKLNLSNLPKFEAPTNKRYSDGALISILKITSNGKTYSSADFDSGNPPAELKDLYNSIAPGFRKK